MLLLEVLYFTGTHHGSSRLNIITIIAVYAPKSLRGIPIEVYRDHAYAAVIRDVSPVIMPAIMNVSSDAPLTCCRVIVQAL